MTARQVDPEGRQAGVDRPFVGENRSAPLGHQLLVTKGASAATRLTRPFGLLPPMRRLIPLMCPEPDAEELVNFTWFVICKPCALRVPQPTQCAGRRSVKARSLLKGSRPAASRSFWAVGLPGAALPACGLGDFLRGISMPTRCL